MCGWTGLGLFFTSFKVLKVWILIVGLLVIILAGVVNLIIGFTWLILIADGDGTLKELKVTSGFLSL